MTFTRLILGNVLIDERGGAWGVYRVPVVSYPLLPTAEKVQLLEQLAAFAQGARGDITLWRVTRSEHLSGPDSSRNRAVEVYAAIKLDAEPIRASHGLLLRTPRRIPGRMALTRSTVERIRDAELAPRTHAHATLGARPATSQELVWLSTRLRTLGVGEPDVDPNDDRAPLIVRDHDSVIVEAVDTTNLALTRATLEERPRELVVMAPTGHAAHQAVLTVGVLPDALTFPGRAEIAFGPIERSGVICDVIIHARWTSNAAALKRAARTITDADNATSEQASTGRVSDTRLLTQLDAAIGYKRYLESSEAPAILTATISLVVAAQSSEALEQACTELTAALAPVHVSRPAHIQRKLWDAAQMPGRRAHGARAQHLTIHQLAAIMPIATEYVGSAAGATLGELRASRRAVRLDLTAASRASRPPSILCVGTLGSGKTMTSQVIARDALLQGSLVVDVDPKPDHRLDELPELAGRTRLIDLSDTEQHAGLLDPLRVSDPSMRDEIASGFYADLIDATARQRAHIRTALTNLGGRLHMTSADFVRELRSLEHPEAVDAAEQLAAWANSGLARLALGESRSAIDADAAPNDLTSIRCRSLSLPDAATPRSQYTEAERVSCAVMRLIATYALQLALSDSTRHKLVMIDEAWLLLGSTDGRSLIDRINRTGRSENATLLLATQQLGDAAHTAPLIGTHMVFGVETREEARQAAALLGLDDTDELAAELQRQRTGQAVMRDIDGNLGRIQITVPPELLSALSTVPKGGTA